MEQQTSVLTFFSFPQSDPIIKIKIPPKKVFDQKVKKNPWGYPLLFFEFSVEIFLLNFKVLMVEEELIIAFNIGCGPLRVHISLLN